MKWRAAVAALMLSGIVTIGPNSQLMVGIAQSKIIEDGDESRVPTFSECISVVDVAHNKNRALAIRYVVEQSLIKIPVPSNPKVVLGLWSQSAQAGRFYLWNEPNRIFELHRVFQGNRPNYSLNSANQVIGRGLATILQYDLEGRSITKKYNIGPWHPS